MRSLATTVVFLLALSCVRSEAGSAMILVSELPDGYALADRAAASRPEAVVRSQLRYAIGALAPQAVGVAVELADVRIRGVRPIGAWDSLVEIRYDAVIPIAWPRERKPPRRLTLSLPERSDSAGLEAFFKRNRQLCAARIASFIRWDNFWYHYRPQRCGNALSLTTTVTINLASVGMASVSELYSWDPWSDGALRIAVVFTRGGAAGGRPDAGEEAHRRFLEDLEDGGPARPRFIVDAAPGARQPLVARAFTPSGAVEATVALVDDLTSAGAGFVAWLQGRARDADLVVYNGHAGLGRDIRAFAAMLDGIAPERAQLLVVNACQAFAHVDSSLLSRGTVTRHVVAAVTPLAFDTGPPATLALIEAAVSGGGGFAAALAPLGDDYRVAVIAPLTVKR